MIILKQKTGVWRDVLAVLDDGRDSVTVNPFKQGAEEIERRASGYDGPPALILWSSGTTGEPKGVVVPWETVRIRCRQVGEALGYGPSSVVFCGGLGCHNFGMISAALAAHFAGARLVEAENPMQPATIQVAMAETFCTHALLLTGQAENLVHNRLLAGVRSERIYLGGTPVSEDLRAGLAAATGAVVFDSLGITETGTIAKSDGGKIDGWVTPYPDIEARAVNGRLEWRTPGLAWGTIENGPFRVDDGWWSSDDLGEVEGRAVRITSRVST